MKISKITPNVSFAKRIVAKCNVIKNEKFPYPCIIYELNEEKDKDYFTEINNQEDWEHAKYKNYLIDDLKHAIKSPNLAVYVMEAQDGKCLGYTELINEDDNTVEILLLETNPKQVSKRNKNLPIFKYIGETLLAFTVKKAKRENKTAIQVQPSITAEKFYTDKCFFKKPADYYKGEPFVLPRSRFKKFIDQNRMHTKSSINIVG